MVIRDMARQDGSLSKQAGMRVSTASKKKTLDLSLAYVLVVLRDTMVAQPCPKS